MKISAYTLSYTIVAPSGEMYPTQEVVMYTASQERAIQLLDAEIQRTLGEGVLCKQKIQRVAAKSAEASSSIF